MAREPVVSFGDLETRMAAFRAALEREGLASRMVGGQLETQLAQVRDHLAASIRAHESGAPGAADASPPPGSGTRPLLMTAPIRDRDGRIDVAASTLNQRLIRDAVVPTVAGLPVTIRLLLALFTAGSRIVGRDPRYGRLDEAMRAFFQQARDSEAETGS